MEATASPPHGIEVLIHTNGVPAVLKIQKSGNRVKPVGWSVDLEECAKEYYAFAKETENCPEMGDNVDVANAIQRYAKFMMLQHRNANVPLVPPFDVKVVWLAHLIRVSMYRDDCLRTFGKVIDCKVLESTFRVQASLAQSQELWKAAYGAEFKFEYQPGSRRVKIPSVGLDGINFQPSIKPSDVIADRQWISDLDSSYRGFVFNDTFVHNAKTAYDMYMYMLSKNPECALGPPVTVDLIWHAHMCNPLHYDADSKSFVGRIVLHSPWPEKAGTTQEVEKQFEREFGSTMREITAGLSYASDDEDDPAEETPGAPPPPAAPPAATATETPGGPPSPPPAAVVPVAAVPRISSKQRFNLRVIVEHGSLIPPVYDASISISQFGVVREPIFVFISHENFVTHSFSCDDLIPLLSAKNWFCSVRPTINGRDLDKKKTSVAQKCAVPQWNETLGPWKIEGPLRAADHITVQCYTDGFLTSHLEGEVTINLLQIPGDYHNDTYTLTSPSSKEGKGVADVHIRVAFQEVERERRRLKCDVVRFDKYDCKIAPDDRPRKPPMQSTPQINKETPLAQLRSTTCYQV